ncbi:hypothetical protein [Actinomadura rugatobispora]|uniref:Uncharacterized protein n=1 Tax=Actinomadura rugatobispora TaxID=1994 RepID=A0ABW0ZVH7_9ACTN|nr:hypothetical protein GCM10010200_040360 [Actinomadura rugatobispora]
MGRAKTLGVTTAAVVGGMALLIALIPAEVALTVLVGALLLGVATLIVCLVLIPVTGRSRVPPEHGTVDVDGTPEPAVIFGLARRRLVLGVIVMAATVPMSFFLGGVPLLVSLADRDADETGWAAFPWWQAASAPVFLGAGIYLIERTIWAWRELRRPAHVACTSTVLQLELPEYRIAIPWDDIMTVGCDGKFLGVAVVDDSAVWTRLGRRAERNMRDHGCAIWAATPGIDPDLFLHEMDQRLTPPAP